MCTSQISLLNAGDPASSWTSAICSSLRGSNIKLTVVWHFFDNWHLHKQVLHAHVHIRKLKCKVNKIIIVCFFSKTYCKSLSFPLMTEILCAKPSNLIYISWIHAILLLQSLYRIPCELNNFIVKSQHSCGQITLLATLCERTDTHQKPLLLLSLWSTAGDFGGRLLPLLSSPLPPKENPAPGWAQLLISLHFHSSQWEFFCLWWREQD